MNEGDNLILSLPNMLKMFENKFTNCINFEHTIFLTEPYVEYLMAENGFSIITKSYFMDQHGIFYAARRDQKVAQIPLSLELYEKIANCIMTIRNITRNLLRN